MKTLVIFLVVLLSSMHTNAVHLSTDGSGQVLIFPYYTVNNGFNTLISLTNTTDQAKALRVRFREAANSHEVFAFNLYLGAHDMWTGALLKGTDDEDNFTKIISNDVSCTIPNTQSNLFTKDQFVSASDPYGNETKRMHEGFIEVIEMGVLTGDSAAAALIIPGQIISNCYKLNDAWDANSDNPYWFIDPDVDLLAPSGGITGNIVLINVAQGISVSEEPTAIKAFSDEILHFAIDNDSPSLADGNTIATVIDSLGKTYQTSWQTGFEALSSVLMKSTISNEYVLSESIGANTDWIITFPTRQFHIDSRIAGPEIAAIAPFTFINNALSLPCENADYMGIYDRETQTPMPGVIVIGTPPPPRFYDHQLCYSTNGMSVTNSENNLPVGSGIYASNHPISPFFASGQLRGWHLETPFDEGWMALSFLQKTQNNNENIEIFGLPMIGFSTQKFVNGNLGGGTLANYAESFKHKSTVHIETEVQPLMGMHIAEDNSGQVLLYPYYTVRSGFDTLISVVNTTDKVKALKVRFREGKNARDVLDFNLYLSPYDVWTAALVAINSTLPNHVDELSVKLLTNDSSCTVPTIHNQEFLPYGYDPQDNGQSGSGYDGMGTNLERVQEGFFEIIEMGELVGADAIAATHVMGVPADCQALINNWSQGGKWVVDPVDDLSAPDGYGGLFGSLQLINVADGIDMGYDATAIKNYSTAIQHSEPANLIPNLASGNQSTTLIENQGNTIQTIWNSPLDAVSALFMQESISNDYVITDGIGAQTDWVNTYPTKQFYVDPFFANDLVPLPPFNSTLTPEFGACEEVSFVAYNREQIASYDNSIIGVSPPTPRANNCYSVNTSYGHNNSNIGNQNSADSIFGTQLLMNDWFSFNGSNSIYNLEFTEGWMQTTLGQGMLEGVGANGETHKIYGKPVVGFVAQKYVNGTLEDNDGNSILANYAAISLNKSKRRIEVIEAQ